MLIFNPLLPPSTVTDGTNLARIIRQSAVVFYPSGQCSLFA
ncbi:hypothetical protein PANA5342_pPANA10078 (plasmid) [Pantoea ananatis LMG 5342]|nr:hypothetical protein PANA5342_pPANA10078 [Pantoea ananatis LMG 5342]